MTSGDENSLHHSVGLLGISAGSLLLTVNSYTFTREVPLIPSTAVGVLLVVLAALLAYAGVRRSRKSTPLFVSLCLAISMLWCSYGLNCILRGQGVLPKADDFRNTTVPGLAAFSLALFILGVVGFLQKDVPPAVMSCAISLACAHDIAGLYDVAFGSSATAGNHLIVCLVGLYFGIGRVLDFLTGGRVILPGTQVPKSQSGGRGQSHGGNVNDSAVVGLISNMISASVFGCRLLGVSDDLSVGQVPWLWVAGVYQLGVCVFSYRSFDPPAAVFFGFASVLKFAGGYSLLYRTWQTEEPVFPVPLLVVFAFLFSVLALFATGKSLLDGLYSLFFTAYCVALACHPRGFFGGGPQGVDVAVFVASASMTLVYSHNAKAGFRIPTGEGTVKTLFSRTALFKLRRAKDLRHPDLGYSKYADAEGLGYGCGLLASFAIAKAVDPQAPLATVILPWVVVAGGILQLIPGFVAFSRGKTLESSAFVLYGIVWIIWGLTRYGGICGTARGFHLAVGIVAIMVLNCFIVFSSLFLSVAWFFYSLTFELVLISFLLDAIDATPVGYDTAVAIIFGVVSFYCFTSALFNGTFESPRLPLGSPFLKLSGIQGGKNRCPHLPARKASSVKQIAEIMKNGGACGIPTDTVYVLVAACNRPDAVEKAYNTKKQAQDRPMSLWISSLRQLEPAKHLFHPILWDFMEAAWPSPISVVVPRGDWIDQLGLKTSARYVGTPRSIAIRIPDCSVTTHLIDLVGPVAVTSANPTGEADTTHHDQVYAKLGDKVDGVLCAGPSPENIASTVVDCTKIESGNIGFFRVGIVPKSQVLQILERVQRNQSLGQTSTVSEEEKHSPQRPLGAVSNGKPTASPDGLAEASYANGGFGTEEEDVKL
ncbi:uncharacterized protein LOC100084527 [Ornithorhynchus anatinus]|uniref:Threonylcarbamoyl-AMP synthase n=1 Tax=Ornithorhynchus anatinus TaxID=9258 RepID=A0A6I8N582_ORNAN|nr:uncharacterized protein LOC100084527 [Ornithorhynchus anatinus]